MNGRRLTAILAADVAGFSALMTASSKDDTLSALKGHQGVVLPMVTGYDGRVVEATDGGILAEFPSVLNAVKCAVTIQEMMQERNAATSPERRLQFRIGITQGEVVPQGESLAGESVEIAKRLDDICDPGGICIAGNVYGEIKERYTARYRDIGEQSLKDMPAPVRVYRIGMTRLSTETLPPLVPPMSLPRVPSVQLSQKQWIAAGAAVAVVLLLGAGAAWWGLAPSKPAQQVAAKSPAAQPSLPTTPPVAPEASPSAPPAATAAPSEPAPAESKAAAIELPPAADNKDAILAPPPAATPVPSELAPENKEAILAPSPSAPSAASESDRKSTRLNSSHIQKSRMPSSA